MLELLKGQIVTYKKGDVRVLMSTDKSLVRFVLKSPVEECKLQMTRTNYKDILIMRVYNADGTPVRGQITGNYPLAKYH